MNKVAEQLKKEIRNAEIVNKAKEEMKKIEEKKQWKGMKL